MDLLNPLAPIFAASVAVQQIIEVFSVIIERRQARKKTASKKEESEKAAAKKAASGIIGFIAGIALARAFGLDVMQYFQINSMIPGLDTIVTALVLSAGTEGTNSIVKFLKYLKEDKKATAAETLESLRKRSRDTTATGAATGARGTLEKLRTRAAGTTARSSVTPPAEDDASSTAAYSYISAK